MGNLTYSASGFIVKHQGGSFVENTTVSMGQESTVGKWIQSKVACPCLNVMMGTNGLVYALKYATSKTDQLLVWFWHLSCWIPFLYLGSAIIWDFIDTSVHLPLTYRISLVEDFTVIAGREYWLVPINEDIYPQSLQIAFLKLSWLESLSCCEHGEAGVLCSTWMFLENIMRQFWMVCCTGRSLSFMSSIFWCHNQVDSNTSEFGHAHSRETSLQQRSFARTSCSPLFIGVG